MYSITYHPLYICFFTDFNFKANMPFLFNLNIKRADLIFESKFYFSKSKSKDSPTNSILSNVFSVL